MVLVLDGSSEYVGHAWRKLGLVGEKKIVIALDLTKCLTEIKFIISLYTREHRILSYHLISVSSLAHVARSRLSQY